jgi:hypothetical protein
MESKKINQLATNVAPQTSDLTIIGDPITGVSKKITLLQIANLFATTGTVTSVAVTETGNALTITGSPITSAGTINIGFAGAASQYVRGDGALADFPTSTGGGSSVSYYLNSSVSQGTIGGNAYRQLSKTPVIGAGTDITISANGYIANYITDANDPALLEVPGGNFNCEFYFSVNSNNHNPYVYAELYKYDGTTFTLLGSSQTIPEYLTNGTTLSSYYFAIPVATAALTITDRLAIRIYVNVDTRVVTLHTENSHLCQVVTTFSKGLTSLNNLTRQVQFLATGTSGTDFNISSSTATHTFNLPVASATNTGKLSSTDWSVFNSKEPAITSGTTAQYYRGDKTFQTLNTTAVTEGSNLYYTDARSRAALSAGTGISYNNTTGVITSTITQYTDVLARAALSVTAPLTYNSSTGVFNINQSSSTVSGWLSFTDWNTFNGKQAALNGTGFVKISGTTISYDNSTYLTTSSASSTYLPLAGGTLTGQLVINRASGNGLQVASDNVVITAATGFGSPRQLVFTCGNGPTTTLEAKGFGGNYITDFNIKTYNSSGTAFNVFFGTSAGDVGIGTDTPLSRLQVVATGTILRLGEASGTTGKQLLFGVDSASGRGEIQAVWQGTSNTPLGLNVAGGNVLIGTTTDNGAKLNINGNIIATQGNFFQTASSGFGITLRNRNANQQWGLTVDVNAVDDKYLGLYDITNSAYRMVVTNGGNVGIGTSNPTQRLYVLGTGANTQTLTLESTSANANAYAVFKSSNRAYITGLSGDLSSSYIIYDETFGAARFQILANGITLIPSVYNQTSGSAANVIVGSDGNLFRSTSSLKYKKNVENYTKGLAEVMQLRAVTYNGINELDGDKQFAGLIAEEIHELGLTEFVQYAEDGTPDALAYQNMIALAFKAIQEQQAQIEELKAKIK